MKILMYSDIHISKTSSILPLSYNDSSKYTYRQQMIIDTGKYLADLADEYNVDLIINLGDTFDQHTVTSYDIDTASEFFKAFRLVNKPHLVLVGNHEMINSNFNAIQLLNNISNITVISEPATVNTCMLNTGTDEPSIELAFLPYCNYTDILEYPKGKYLFSHLDIQGAVVRGDITLAEGVDMKTIGSKYDLVFNGHIHKPSICKNIINVGSVTTHSFADDNASVPQCYIFDTTTLDLKTFKPTICPLFRKISVANTTELTDILSTLDFNYNYILNCKCKFEDKEQVKQVFTDVSNVLNYRLSVDVSKTNTDDDTHKLEGILQKSTLDIKQAFKEFLSTVDLKYPIDMYKTVIDNMSKGEL